MNSFACCWNRIPTKGIIKMVKICTRCGLEKSMSEFRKNRMNKDGLQRWCKICMKTYQAAYWQAHKEELDDCRKSYRADHKEEMANYQRAYLQTESGRTTHKRYRQNHSEKIKAHQAVHIVTRNGSLKRSVFCETCGLPTKTHGHHADYTKPLEVEWLCRKCHVKVHNKRRKEKV